jgi:hypothetical protein
VYSHLLKTGMMIDTKGSPVGEDIMDPRVAIDVLTERA